MQLTVKEFLGQFRDHLGVLSLEFLDESVHLHLGQEVGDVLPVVKTEIGEVLSRRTLDSEDNLVEGILVTGELHAGLGVDLFVDFM